MKTKIIISVLACALIFGFGVIFVHGQKSVQQPEVLGAFDQKILTTQLGPDRVNKTVKQVNFPELPNLSARSVLVYLPDYNSIIFSKDVVQPMPIASLTKLMTALVASKQLNFNKPITITKADELSTAPSLHLKAGDTVMPKDLVEAMLIGSANDAALTLANHFSDYNTFVLAMNAQAKYLGMTDTSFSTPIGFDQTGNYSTAIDLQKLVNYALANLDFDSIWAEKNFSFKSTSGKNFSINASNALVYKHTNIKSIKTGLTPAAKGNMIVEAEENGNKIISIILGSSDRDQDTLNIINYIFSNFSW